MVKRKSHFTRWSWLLSSYKPFSSTQIIRILCSLANIKRNFGQNFGMIQNLLFSYFKLAYLYNYGALYDFLTFFVFLQLFCTGKCNFRLWNISKVRKIFHNTLILHYKFINSEIFVFFYNLNKNTLQLQLQKNINILFFIRFWLT